MVASTLRNVGGSLVMTVPKAITDELGLQANTKFDVTAQDGNIIAVPRRRPKYTVEQLVAEWEVWPERTAEEQEWLDMPSVGNEIIE
ncbi:AbrB/MazE/SpoVT family DNA-binding domain-containing protein [Rhizobium tumorigenes]|uniref:Antitoxin n=1 Tax=Rhizobium tumorigenes TaxID=2041385 RepID=A0AAF1K686_9HYPH|nr:antitoxin [Rhizobium tumorigenes]WFR95746.1 antitoxin [Rhizobium tumorigenes]